MTASRRLTGLAGLMAATAIAACSVPVGASPSDSEPSGAPPTAAPSGSHSPGPSASVGNPSPAPTTEHVLPTFEVWTSSGGTPVGCDTIGVDDPVFGLLRGDASATDFPIWLESPAGEKLHVVWPSGFTVRFEPGPVVASETGAIVAREGDAIALQVGRAEAAGTEGDPYIASGIMTAGPQLTLDSYSGATFTGCYPRLPE